MFSPPRTLTARHRPDAGSSSSSDQQEQRILATSTYSPWPVLDKDDELAILREYQNEKPQNKLARKLFDEPIRLLFFSNVFFMLYIGTTWIRRPMTYPRYYGILMNAGAFAFLGAITFAPTGYERFLKTKYDHVMEKERLKQQNKQQQ